MLLYSALNVQYAYHIGLLFAKLKSQRKQWLG
jgi:hypothetical protein